MTKKKRKDIGIIEIVTLVFSSLRKVNRIYRVVLAL